MWGEALGAQSAHLGAYQGHGSVATPHNILITWAVIMQGGFQVNIEGRRFCDESLGYSEQAAEVLRQPGGVAWSVFDARIAAVARQFEDFRNAERTGAIVTRRKRTSPCGCHARPARSLRGGVDRDRSAQDERSGAIGMDVSLSPGQHLAPPFHAVKVTGALFHTQGGLAD